MKKFNRKKLLNHITQDLCRRLIRWGYEGEVQGDEFRSGDATGTVGDSCFISLKTGLVHDFNPDASPVRDIIEGVARRRGISYEEAGWQIIDEEGLDTDEFRVKSSVTKRESAVVPVPNDVEEPKLPIGLPHPKHPDFKLSGYWRYLNADGSLHHIRVRYDGKKKTNLQS